MKQKSNFNRREITGQVRIKGLQVKPTVERVCYEFNLELVWGMIPQMILINFLGSISKNMIMFENAFPLRNWTLLLYKQVTYVQDIIVSRDTDLF